MLALLVFATHGVSLFNDGVYWDGWLLYGHYVNRDVETLLSIFRNAGSPWAGYFHWAFWLAPNPVFAYRLVAFLAAMLSTLMVFFIAQRISILSSRERWFIAAVFCCYPAFQAQVAIILAPMRLLYMLFFIGLYLALRSLETSGRPALIRRALALVIIGASFSLNSLLVFYFPILFLIISEKHPEWSADTLPKKLLKSLRYGDLILLPFAYWAISNLIWKATDEYSGYNQLAFSPKLWFTNFWKSIDNTILSQFDGVMTLAGNRPMLAAFVILMAVLFERANSARRGTREFKDFVEISKSENSANMLKIGLFAVVLLFCALFPYLVVGKFPTAEGWDSRHAALVSLPVAVLLVAIGRGVHLILPFNLTPNLLRVFSGILVLSFVLLTCKVYLAWQVRWIKDQSFIVNLQKLPKALVDRINLFIVNDAYYINKEFYRHYEYSVMFKMAWGSENKIGFHPTASHDEDWVLKNVPLRNYLLTDFRSGGCQAMVTIRPKRPETSYLKLVGNYMAYRWFYPSELPNFLSDHTTLELSDVKCPDLK
ncbi:MAG: hypothetical protein M0P95_04270 [Sulfuritalea sp.]|nr:hypothetical protein [Sulfuritalea sp.]